MKIVKVSPLKRFAVYGSLATLFLCCNQDDIVNTVASYVPLGTFLVYVLYAIYALPVFICTVHVCIFGN